MLLQFARCEQSRSEQYNAIQIPDKLLNRTDASNVVWDGIYFGWFKIHRNCQLCNNIRYIDTMTMAIIDKID